MAKCGCGTHELTDQERRDLPRCQGITFCFQSCISAFETRWRAQQRRLGFDIDVVADPVEEIDLIDA